MLRIGNYVRIKATVALFVIVSVLVVVTVLRAHVPVLWSGIFRYVSQRQLFSASVDREWVDEINLCVGRTSESCALGCARACTRAT